MKNFLILLVFAGISLFITSCNKTIPADLSSVAFIPHPVKVQPNGISFQLERNNVIEISDADKLEPLAEFLKAKLNSFTGLEYEIKVVTMASGKNIYLGLDSNTLNSDGYQLEITKVGVTMIAKEEQGIFYGIQTLLQSITFNDEYLEWIIPGGTILDYSKYAYRGVMLDVARHFFSIDDVKQLIDLMAAYKLNNLHLHLSDDQGWRIEIKSWPKLTEIGSTTAVNGDQGGYYTQEQYKEIVQYAKDHYITIIPEIDMPGHTNAALASYAELNCDNKARDLYTGIEVGFSTLCTNKEITYQFVEDVIRELAEITEGPYIHIGGDESLVTEKEDYIYFMNRVREITKKYDKMVMGWDEIAHADIDKNDVVQYWSVDENATLAVSKGAKVLMSPSKKAYLDMQYDSTTHLGLHWAAYIELDSAYMWRPEEMIEGVGKNQILGVESPLWTETITNSSEMQYMMFPRLVGHAEIGWSPNEHLNWEEYKMRLAKHSAYLEKLNINYYKSPQIDWPIE